MLCIPVKVNLTSSLTEPGGVSTTSIIVEAPPFEVVPEDDICVCSKADVRVAVFAGCRNRNARIPHHVVVHSYLSIFLVMALSAL